MIYCAHFHNLGFVRSDTMHNSANIQSPRISVVFLCSCEVYHKQEVWFLLYLLGQIVTWQYNPADPLDQNWPCTVINDHDWQLRNCPLYFRPNFTLGFKTFQKVLNSCKCHSTWSTIIRHLHNFWFHCLSIDKGEQPKDLIQLHTKVIPLLSQSLPKDFFNFFLNNSS